MPTDPEQLVRWWGALYDTFDPEEPVREERLRAHRDDRYDAIAALEGSLRLPFGHGTRKFLVSGAVGSGKTTELYGVAERLVDCRVVVVLDLWRHFQQQVGDPAAMDHLQPWEVVGLFGLAILRAADQAFGFREWDGADQAFQIAFQRMKEKDEPDGRPAVDVWKLAGQLAVAAGGALADPTGIAVTTTALKLFEATDPKGSFTLRIGRRHRTPRDDQDPPVRALVEATNALVHKLNHRLSRPVLLVVDGLDRVSLDETLDQLFVDSRLLAELSCEQVLCVPVRLLRSGGSNMRGYLPVEVTNVPVLDQADPSRPGAGVTFFHDLVRRRLAQPQLRGFQPFSDAQIERLAWCSGGRVRDFVRLVRGVAERNGATRADVTDEMVEAAVDLARRALEFGLDRDQIEVLERIAHDPRRLLPSGEVALRLLDEDRLLACPNRSTWYHPHPLLTLVQVPIPPSGSRAS